ncbi:MAG: DEAD/DEAH box helicase [Fibrobacter sp.]|nr:DEAD/DEAH box helicase [Fibrobacter sp.]
MNPLGPLIIQSNLEILIEVNHERYEEARDAIAPFTELIKSPEYLHTYKISHLSLWNAASAGLTPDEVLARLEEFGKFETPAAVVVEVQEYMSRYGRLKLYKKGKSLILEAEDEAMLMGIQRNKSVATYLGKKIDEHRISVPLALRGHIKMALTNTGFPVQDLAGYVEGEALNIELRTHLLDSGDEFKLRQYQQEAAQVFYASGSEKGGSGVIVLPCGSGKTIIGMATMALVKTRTLILTPNITAARQWIRELIDKTNLTEDQVTEYSGEVKQIGPVTVATYQILTQRRGKDSKELTYFDIFSQHRWGLMIYDEVHLLPAPVFRMSAEMQATRRLGLTATLVREDGKETEVFSLIGPKKYDIPWRVLESQGWIAKAICSEIRIPMDTNLKMKYAMAEMREKIRIASCNPQKIKITKQILNHHQDPTDRVLIIGQYLDQLDDFAAEYDIPLITGKTKNKDRDILYSAFRNGEITSLIVSKVGNFAIDLPDANILIQVSGTFGSRQEEAQRLGRVLRPKKDGRSAYFYTLVSRDSREQEFSMNRQLFLTEQGYTYNIVSPELGEEIDFLEEIKQGD